MTFTTNSLFTTDIQLDVVQESISLFNCLSVDDQLAVLWYLYTEAGRSITPAAPGSARLQLAEGLLNQIKAMSQPEQLQVMRDLAAKSSTPMTRAYGVLSANTKLAFWYQLAEMMVQGSVVPMPAGYQMTRDAQQVFSTIQNLDFGQQITVLRKAVVDMGVDPFAV